MDDMAYYMKRAIEKAKEAAQKGEVPIGAILVDEQNRILAEAHNKPIALSDPTAHAEILAIRNAAKLLNNYRLTSTTLYVTIEPCIMCAGALVNARVKRLVYGAPDLKAGACGSLMNLVQDSRLNHRLDVVKGVLENECRALIQDFFSSRRKQGGEVPKRS